ncbi:MAG TPA: site-2 protease family protein [Candidatus Nanoarchaeia archaeon]|nr:site-2 protease family protein [Candidatus Nanoarchaeia archaeon]
MALIDALKDHFWTIIFYSAILLLLYINRKKFEFHGVAAIKRTKIGIKLMDRWGLKHPKPIKVLGFIGIIVCFLLMIATFILLLYGVFQFFTVKNAPPSVAPLLPGVEIPGSPVNLPLIAGFLAIFFVIVVHEFAHGVVSRAYKIPVKTTGFGLFAIFPFAFVEPDEKKLKKSSTVAQLSLFSAGAFTNVIFAIFTVFILLGVGLTVGNYLNSKYESIGFTFDKVEPGSPAKDANLIPKITYTEINGKQIRNTTDLFDAFSKLRPGDLVTLSDGQNSYNVVSSKSKLNESKAYVGISGIKQKYVLKNKEISPIIGTAGLVIYSFLNELLTWIIILNIAVGSVNVLPMGPIDGGRMFLLSSQKIFGKTNGEKVWKMVSFFVVFIMIILLFQFVLSVAKAF